MEGIHAGLLIKRYSMKSLRPASTRYSRYVTDITSVRVWVGSPNMLEKSVKYESQKIVGDLISSILMKGKSHHVFSSCTNTEWVRDPWLGRVGVVEVKAFVAPPISMPCSSITVQAPCGRHIVPLMMSLVRRTCIRISPTELSTRTESPDRSLRSSPSLRLMTRTLGSKASIQGRFEFWELTRYLE